MNNQLLLVLLLTTILHQACNSPVTPKYSETDLWKLSWRMMESELYENYELAELQFDSLYQLSEHIDHEFLKTGVQVKIKQDKLSEVNSILATLPESSLIDVCPKLKDMNVKLCTSVPKEVVDKPALKLELIEMFVHDQAARYNMMDDLISEYAIDTTGLSYLGVRATDEKNRNRLKEIIATHGFPTRKMVGKVAMEGIFYIIQHANKDAEWQKAQLPLIEQAVKKGDMVAKDYAYLYDRIQSIANLQQRYGTQIRKVDKVNGIVELKVTEDIENLNQRRREFGMMPIEMYKRIMLKM